MNDGEPTLLSTERDRILLPDGRRRQLLQVGAGSLLASLVGCGGGGESEATPTRPPSAQPAGKYRCDQVRLFQPIPRKEEPTHLPGGQPYSWLQHGATYEYVDLKGGWPWDNAGGDWIDKNLLRMGNAPWFSFTADKASGSAAVYAYAVDVTEALKKIRNDGRWNALILRSSGAPRTIASLQQTIHPKPVIEVTYDDDSSATLNCLFAANFSPGSVLTNSADPKHAIPVALEFEIPTKSVRQAMMRLTVTEHWSGSAPVISGFVLDPPVNRSHVEWGLAAAHGRLDIGLDSDTNIIGVHRYADGALYQDFVVPGPKNTGAEREFDPAIFGTGPTDRTKLPHAGLGKWINAESAFDTYQHFSLVSSSYTGEGFEPLVPGLGAMRIEMRAQAGIGEGAVVGYSGTTASVAKIYLPEPEFGVLKRLFVRYYMRLGKPYATPFSKRHQVYNELGGSPSWSDLGGKIGITPAHDTTYGGVSGTSGGGYGWQMRLGWADCDTGIGGPNENAIGLGLHTYDFQFNNLPGHRYSTDAPRNTQFGQRGGLAGTLYPGFWYCIEMEVDLNTVMDDAPGFLADGAVRMWIDGRLSYERSGMVMRSLPLYSPSVVSETNLRPVRQLGHRDLWLNWFHGGKTQNTLDRHLFFTGLAWGKRYIGPMLV